MLPHTNSSQAKYQDLKQGWEICRDQDQDQDQHQEAPPIINPYSAYSNLIGLNQMEIEQMNKLRR